MVMDSEKYQEMQDQIDSMRKVTLSLEDFHEGPTMPADDVFNEIDQIVS